MKHLANGLGKHLERTKWLIAVFAFSLNIFVGLAIATPMFMPSAQAAGEEYGLNYNKKDQDSINRDLRDNDPRENDGHYHSIERKTAVYAKGGVFSEGQPPRLTAYEDKAGDRDIQIYTGNFNCQGYSIGFSVILDLPTPIESGPSQGMIVYNSIRGNGENISYGPVNSDGRADYINETNMSNALPGICRPANYAKDYAITAVNIPNSYQTGGLDGWKRDTSPNNNSGSGSTTGGGDSNDPDMKLDCDTVSTNPLTWVLCPVMDLMTETVEVLDGMITDQLEVKDEEIFCNDAQCGAYYKAWKSFRNIALGLMVITGLVILIAQALGMEILDAYTIRKMLPRILIAAVGITVSWPLMQLLISFSNDLAFGVRHLIYLPFSDLSGEVDLSFGNSFTSNMGNFFFGAAGLAAGVGAGILLIGVIFSLLGTAALAVFIALVILALRQVAIILMLLIAPIAIIAYVLPGTQKVYKFWWESFSKALLMFPLIAAFIATGRVFSAVMLSHNPNLLNQIIGFLAYFAPYFLIPMTVAFAGGAMRQIGGFVNDRSRGGFDRLRKRRGNQISQVGQDIRSGNAGRWLGTGKPDSMLNRTRRGLQRSALLGNAGIRPSMWRKNINQAIAANDARGTSKELLNEQAMKPILGNDDLSEALANNDFDLDRTRAALTEKFGAEKAGQMVSAYAVANRALRQKGYSDRAIQIGTVLSGLSASTALTGKENFDDEGNYIGASRVAETIQRLSGGDANLQAQMIAGAMEANPQRPEIAPSFSEMFGAVTDIENASSWGDDVRQEQVKQSGKTLRRITIYKKGLNALFASGHSAKHMAQEYETMVQEAHANHVKAQAGQAVTGQVYNSSTGKLETRQLTKEEAEDRWLQMAAEVVAAQNNAGNLALEKRPIVGELIDLPLGRDENDQEVTMHSETIKLRTDARFQKYVSDYGFLQQARGATAEEMAAAAKREAGARGRPPDPTGGFQGGNIPT